MRRDWLLIILFGLTLICMGALVSWWTILINEAVHLEQQVAKSELQMSAYQQAAILGADSTEPVLQGDLSDSLGLVGCVDNSETAPIKLLPHHPTVCVQPLASAITDIENRLSRRHAMVKGEGIFLFGLLAVCSLILYYFIGQKQRHASRMESFFHAATHEMKTPLTGIKTLLETLRARRVPDSEHDKLLDLGLEGCQRLERRIENVLIAGGLRTGGQQAHLTTVNLTALLSRYVDQRSRNLSGRPEGVYLASQADEEQLVLVDKDLLIVVMDNLVDNGLKYGGLEPRVEITVVEEESTVLISVSDQGVGFEPSHNEALFTPYRRALSEGHKNPHGTGLGLSIARDLCRQMGGDLVSHSDGLDSGATFTVTIRKTEKDLTV